MKSNTSYRWLIATFMALFLSVQGMSIAHAANYNNAQHDHDGIACALTVVAAENDLVDPTLKNTFAVSINVIQVNYVVISKPSFDTPQTRAPPPRGPPLAF